MQAERIQRQDEQIELLKEEIRIPALACENSHCDSIRVPPLVMVSEGRASKAFV